MDGSLNVVYPNRFVPFSLLWFLFSASAFYPKDSCNTYREHWHRSVLLSRNCAEEVPEVRFPSTKYNG